MLLELTIEAHFLGIEAKGIAAVLRLVRSSAREISPPVWPGQRRAWS
jgi:hypothetical protein